MIICGSVECGSNLSVPTHRFLCSRGPHSLALTAGSSAPDTNTDTFRSIIASSLMNAHFFLPRERDTCWRHDCHAANCSNRGSARRHGQLPRSAAKYKQRTVPAMRSLQSLSTITRQVWNHDVLVPRTTRGPCTDIKERPCSFSTAYPAKRAALLVNHVLASATPQFPSPGVAYQKLAQ